MSSQRIKKPASQLPFRITQARSRMSSMASVKMPPTSSHRQATNNPTRANPVRLSRNTSTAAIGPGPPESGSKKMSKRKAVRRILQIRAIQRRIFADWGTAYEVLMATLLLGEEIASSTTCGTARLANGLELSGPAAQASLPPLYGNLAGNTSSNFPHASRVSCSELLGRTWQSHRLIGAAMARTLGSSQGDNCLDFSRRVSGLARRP